MQLIKSLHDSTRWSKHPASKMWIGYENALKAYMNACIKEWVSRGYNNSMQLAEIEGDIEMPPWLGDETFHRSHRQALLAKKPEHYRQFWPDEEAKIEYVWPSVGENEQ